MTHIARDDAITLLKKYNQDPFHIQHALTVEAVMKWYAKELGYGDDAQNTGASSDCSMILILNFIRMNTASRHRNF